MKKTDFFIFSASGSDKSIENQTLKRKSFSDPVKCEEFDRDIFLTRAVSGK